MRRKPAICIYKRRSTVFGAKMLNSGVLSVLKKLGLYARVIDHVFKPMRLGRLVINMPEGDTLVYGEGQGGANAELTVRSMDFFKKCVLYGDVGFGESYVDGDWETNDIDKVIEWMLINVENHPTLMSDKTKYKPVNFLKALNVLSSLSRKNSRKGSRRNIHEHYDLGNEFYSLFLDRTMTYSSAYFGRGSGTLEEAQYQKYEQLCQKVRLKRTDHLLEIGSGWGGFAAHAVKNFGCHVTTVTVSKEQFDYVKERIRREGLADKLTVELRDYRDLQGEYDKIVSIEMLEAVGHEFYETYFRQCHRLLKKNGLLALQVILSPDSRYASFRKNIDWIQKHIFPGSLLPSFEIIQNSLRKTGTLGLFDYEDMTKHYVKTLEMWHENFNLRSDDILRLGFNPTFMRKWNYYWCYCIAAFRTRNIAVAQMVFSRPNNGFLTESL